MDHQEKFDQNQPETSKHKGTPWLDWIRGTIGTLLIVIAVGAFVANNQQQQSHSIVTAIQALNKDKIRETYSSSNYNIAMTCGMDGNYQTASNVLELSDVKVKTLNSIVLYDTGIVMANFSDNTKFITDIKNCTINVQKLTKES